MASVFCRGPKSSPRWYARFRDPVCVKVTGLPAEFDAFVAKRIVEVAKEVRAPLAPAATCTPRTGCRCALPSWALPFSRSPVVT